MNYGLHIIQFPSGRYGFVGTIPAALGHEVPADKSAVMGGRAYRNARGNIVETKFPSFDTKTEAQAYAQARGYQVSE